MCLKRHRIFLVLLLSLPLAVLGDAPGFLPQDLTLQLWTKQQGLPDNAVTAVLQTRDGYLWVGTSGGLARFDGARFVSVAPAGGATNEILRVTALCEDAAGKLWVGTQGNGLFGFADDSLKRYPARPGELDDTINSIAEDSAGDLWLGTPTGLNVLEKGHLVRFTTKDGLANDFVSNVHVARSGTIWITTRGGISQFKDGRIIPIPIPFQTDSPGRNPESLGVYEDRSTNLWAFGDTYLVNLTEGKHLNHFGSGDNISSLRIWSLCEGRHGELWIGTSGKGLYCFTQDRFFPVTLRNGGLTSDVRALCEDREGNLWLGTYGGGLVRLQPRNVRVLDASVGLPNRPASCLAISPAARALAAFDRSGLFAGTAERFDRLTGDRAADLQSLVSSVAFAPDGSVWAGTLGSGLYCLENQRVIRYGTQDGLADDMILSVAVDTNNVVWAGTFSEGLIRITNGVVTDFGTRNGLQSQSITALFVAKEGELWLGYGDGRVARGAGEKFKPVIEPAVFGNKAIRAIHEDSAGRLWLGTAGGQLACIMPGRYLDWDLNLAPSDNGILGILSDDEGDLWLSTGKVIYHILEADINAALTRQVPMRTQFVFEVDGSSGSPTAYGWPQAAKSPDGKLWFGMACGVVTLDPRRLVFDSMPLPVLVEGVMVNGRALPHQAIVAAGTTNPALGSVRLPSIVRTLDVQFTALNFSEPEKIRFRHRLDGSDPDWVESGSERSVHYGRLIDGQYTFRVQAGTAETWDKNEAAFSFLIPTPLWRTSWAETIYVATAVFLVAAVARMVSNRRLRHRLAILAQQQAMERERMRIAQDMHDEIGSKLTKISFMSERAMGELQQSKPVGHRLESIARTSRDLLQSLDEIVWAVNPHNDTLEHLAAYLGHYATEYLQNTAVECELHIPKSLPHYPLLAEARHNLFLAFEESLNNALKHGHATRIRVEMQDAPGQFEIKVEDNGCGFDAEALASLNPDSIPAGGKRVGNGLRNLRERLAAVGGVCRIRSQPGQGTTVILTVPLAGFGKSK